jgi:polyamine oxidase
MLTSHSFSNYSSIQTFTDKGSQDYSSLLNGFSNAYSTYEQNAGYILTSNLLDTSVRSALTLANWNPKKDMRAQAVEWWNFDWEYSYTPEQSSALFSVINYNTTFYQYSSQNNYVYDLRGFNTIIKGEASTFLKCKLTRGTYDCSGDPRLLLNTVVTKVAHNNTGVTVTNKDGSCISASYAISTVSLGVLQNEVIAFSPPFPDWKQNAIATFQMGTYTKVFLQFPPDKVFWDKQTQFFLYADPAERGYYPVWQSLDGPGFLPGSGIFFATVVDSQSYRAEAQDDATVKAQVMVVLRKMYGAKNVPEPIAFMYPRWSLEEWAFGSYSNWPPGTTLEQHQNLRANLGRLYFAGEATSTEYYGFLHGAWFEGQTVGNLIAGCLNRTGNCPGMENYSMLHGTQQLNQYDEANGWMVTSFQTNGF